MKMLNNKRLLCVAAAVFATVPSLALAHPGHEAMPMWGGLLAGMAHPLLGVDHLLALAFTGGLAAKLQAKQRWGLIAAFLGLMAVGFLCAHTGLHFIAVETVEIGIGVSLVLGAMLLLAGSFARSTLNSSTMPKIPRFNGASAWIMTGFAICHGFAHGYELPANATLSGFGVGFLAVSLGVVSGVSYLSVRVFRSAMPARLEP